MTQEERKLLLKDLCARLPYDVKVCYEYDTSSYYYLNEISPACKEIMIFVTIQDENRKYCAECVLIEEVKPYLRPMSTMTEEEFEEYESFTDTLIRFWEDDELCVLPLDVIDWLNEHHFDYRRVIEKGLAIEAPEGMYLNE